jgi:hypothetical protein
MALFSLLWVHRNKQSQSARHRLAASAGAIELAFIKKMLIKEAFHHSIDEHF